MDKLELNRDRSAGTSSGTISLRIFVALVIGLVGGGFMARRGAAGLDTILAIAAPIGRLWLDALTMTVVPLVFGLLVTGIAGAAATAASGLVARRTLMWFVVLLLASCALSALVAEGVLAMWPIPEGGALLAQAPVGQPVAAGSSDWFAGIIPTNPIKAAADTAMVPLVVFALLFGFAVARIAPSLRDAMLTLLRAIVEAMLVIVHWVLLVAPLGVLALAFAVGAKLGLGAAGTLLRYVGVVAICCLAAGAMVAMVAITVGRLSPSRFLRAALPSQVVALSTQSSLASLPAMIAAAGPLEVGREAAGIVLPLAVSIFRAASAAANMAVALYLAHLHGVPLPIATVIVGVVTAAVVSLAAVGLPAQVSFFATIGPVCLAMGVPVTLLPLLLAVETVPDIFRTFGNVTADLGVMRLAGRGTVRGGGSPS